MCVCVCVRHIHTRRKERQEDLVQQKNRETLERLTMGRAGSGGGAPTTQGRKVRGHTDSEAYHTRGKGGAQMGVLMHREASVEQQHT